MKTAMLLLSFAIIVFSSCTKSTEPVSERVKNSTGATASSTVNKTLMLQLVNEVRKKGCQCGDVYYAPAQPVTWNNQLEQAANNHSMDMYRNNYFSHTAPSGTTPAQRIEQAGYRWMAYGENIGFGYKSEKEVVDAWISSPGHCANLMGKKFKEMGVARVGNYLTQDFGAR
ncbi:MAG: CAP domain-containing protein [Flavisolibacter sp.]|nr:CAP domain-containing protein [Flavisolibacter sp.]